VLFATMTFISLVDRKRKVRGRERKRDEERGKEG
jgi:hypothetical protein